MSDSDADDVLVITAANHWTDARMADRQLAQSISAYGRVLYVDPPVVPRLRSGRPHLETRGAISVLRPYRPPFLKSWANAQLAQRLLAAQVTRALRKMGARSAVLLEANVLFPVSGLVGDARSIYWAQDDWQGLAAISGLDSRRLARNEARLLEQSHAVIAANPLIAAQLEAAGHEVRLIPYGADTDLFRAGDDEPGDPQKPEPGAAVLMGTINTRLDFDILDALADADVPLLLIGPATDPSISSRLEALSGRASVSWIGEVPFTELPTYLTSASVGLVPYTQSRFNKGSFPLKTLEYLSAGLPVVATDLPAIRWLSCSDIRIAEATDDFVSAVVHLMNRGVPDAQDRARRSNFARSHDWSVRAQQVRSVIDEVRSPSTSSVRAA